MSNHGSMSKHAVQRTKQRTSLSTQEINSMISRGIAVDIGSKPGIPKRHLLFYSIPDDACFVAIQDKLVGTVVTVLTLEYHRNLAWDVSEKDCALARERVLAQHQAPPPPPEPPSVFAISCCFTTDSGEPKTAKVAKIPSQPYNDDINVFLADQNVIRAAWEGVAVKGIDKRWVTGFSVQLGKNGLPQFYEAEELALNEKDIASESEIQDSPACC